jgi:histone H3/H4
MATLLVVSSKVKEYVRNKSGMNTSSTFLDAVSRQIEQACDKAIEAARQDGRKTVKDRDLSSDS